MNKKAAIIQLTHRFDNEAEELAFYRKEMDTYRENGWEIALHTVNVNDDTTVVRALQGVSVACCTGNPPVTRKVFEECPDLRIVQRYGIGVNSIDLQAASDHGVVVYNLMGYCIEELATHAVAMFLSLLRDTIYYDNTMKQGKWLKGKGPIIPSRISGMTAGVYGLGGSGKIFAKIMDGGWGAKVIAYDPFVTREQGAAMNVEMVSFEELLERSDVISIHSPLTPETKHAFNKDAFAKMKKNAILLNTARGPIIELNDLYEALANKVIAGAGIDAFNEEPLEAESPLRKLDNIVLTPHSAYHSADSRVIQVEYVSKLPLSMLQDGIIYRKNVANPDVLKKLTGYEIREGLN